MNKSSDILEKIFAGEKASIENTQSIPLSISLVSDDGCQIEMELMPGQVVGFAAGSVDAKIILHHGDPAGLLVIKPESAS
jgi:hypothetical protein